ncbi:S16 family serine protease [Psychrobacillus sp. FSL H8-0484]|uniref:S16 family serine protease n=1 Tax=Psychrobacillus sp. FSL H8-0484 TaxID=2921390 RepID=UPI0030F59AAF
MFDKQKIATYIATGIVTLLLYLVLWFIYYQDLINAFVLVGVLLVVLTIQLICLIIFRKDQAKIEIMSISTIIVAILLFFEFLLLEYEGHTFTASFYADSIEVIDNSGIHLMVVRTEDIGYIEDREVIVKSLEQENDFISLHKINNKARYQSKNAEILRLLRINKDHFTLMKRNVNRYLEGETSSIEAFLNREDISGDSVGLGLALTVLIAQGELSNKLSFGVTGALSETGDVLRIGMIREKVLIAEENGYPFMIIPIENAAEAREIKASRNLNIEIFDVNHIDQAVVLIKKLNEEHSK